MLIILLSDPTNWVFASLNTDFARAVEYPYSQTPVQSMGLQSPTALEIHKTPSFNNWSIVSVCAILKKVPIVWKITFILVQARKKNLRHSSFFLFWPHCMVCGTLVTQPRIEPGPSAMKVWSPNHWIAGKSLDTLINTIWKNTITTKTFKNDAKRLKNVKQSGKVYSQIFDYVSFLAHLVNKCLLNPKYMHVAILYSERGKKKNRPYSLWL